MVTPRYRLCRIVGGKSRLLKAGCPAQAGLPEGMAAGTSEATETINVKRPQHQCRWGASPDLIGVAVILPAATSDRFAIRSLSREPKFEGIRQMSPRPGIRRVKQNLAYRFLALFKIRGNDFQK